MWVDGLPRVVCGLTLSTSCRDVVIALAQSLGNWLGLREEAPARTRF